MNREDAAEVGVYASELFRFVTAAQQTAVAEMVFPIRDLMDEAGDVAQTAVEVGKGLLRSLAANAPDEQRLHLTDFGRLVEMHQRLHGTPAPDVEQMRRAEERIATVKGAETLDAIQQWAANLSEDEERELRGEVLKVFPPSAKRLFDTQTLTTSRTLRTIAYDRYQKLNAFK